VAEEIIIRLEKANSFLYLKMAPGTYQGAIIY